MKLSSFAPLNLIAWTLGGSAVLQLVEKCSALDMTPESIDAAASLSSQGNRALTSYTGIQLCGQTQDSKAAGDDKYFYLFLADDYGFVKGSCLIHFEASDSLACCTVENSMDYDEYWYLTVMDPSSPPYTDGVGGTYKHHWENCNKDVNTDCPNYDYNSNEQGFGQFFVKTSSGDVLSNPDKYVNQGAKCGLGNKLGTCNGGGDNVWGHVHVGKDQCWQSSITLFHQCDGHYGYYCFDCDHGS